MATTIRESASEKIANEVPAASIKQHQRNIETLYIDSDGEVFWDEQPDANTWLQRSDGSLLSLYKIGTGSVACNCDACVTGDDPADWAGSCDGIEELAAALQSKLDEIPSGFFSDEK